MSAKLLNIRESIVMQMSKLAREHNAIDMTQGFPELKTSDKLVSMVNKYMLSGYNQYAPVEGIIELREALSVKTKMLYNKTISAENEITITAGATEAIYTTITAFVDEDDEVIIFEPAYDAYSPIVRLNGGRPVYVQLRSPDYKINWEQVKMHVTARTRMIIINSPHNPTGVVFSEYDYEMLAKMVSGSNIVMLSDEVYEHLVFPDKKHLSVMQFPKLAERSVVVNSFAITLNITGWRIGYTIAPENLTKEIRKIHRFVASCINTPMQYAIAEFLNTQQEDYLNLGYEYQEKHEYFAELLQNTGFKPLPCDGTFFQLIDYSAVSQEKDHDFVIRLAKEYGVACVPISEFYHQKEDIKLLRFCYAKPKEILEEAAKRLSKVKMK